MDVAFVLKNPQDTQVTKLHFVNHFSITDLATLGEFFLQSNWCLSYCIVSFCLWLSLSGHKITVLYITLSLQKWFIVSLLLSLSSGVLFLFPLCPVNLNSEPLHGRLPEMQLGQSLFPSMSALRWRNVGDEGKDSKCSLGVSKGSLHEATLKVLILRLSILNPSRP